MTQIENFTVVNTTNNPPIPESHDVRKLRWTVKQLSKQLGRQGETIHHLRCELAEVRELNGRVERGELRDYERTTDRMDRLIRSLEADNAALLRTNGELYAEKMELESKLASPGVRVQFSGATDMAHIGTETATRNSQG